MPLTYQQALDIIHSFDDPYLAALKNRGQQTWGLDRIRARLNELGNPHLAYPTIHVAGTKGKGSTAAFIAQGLIESGLKTGLYTSPHLQDWRERLQINREWISKSDLASLVDDYQNVKSSVEGLSAFEVTTALAFWYFSREHCDIAVIEVGLGGRLDATSVVEPLVTVITNISLDHTQLLGDTLEKIAAEKAAIIKPHTPVISGPQQPPALKVIEQTSAANASPLLVIGRDWIITPISLGWDGSKAEIRSKETVIHLDVGMVGATQIENAAVAYAALQAAQQKEIPVTDAAIQRGMSEMRWPGRLEKVGENPLIVLDGAHNPYSIERLVEALTTLGGYEALTVIFGCMADKQVSDMLAALLPTCQRIIFTHAENSRAASADDLLMAAQELVNDGIQHGDSWASVVHLEAAADLRSAIELSRQGMKPADGLCITGSLAVVGEARTILLGSADG